MKHVAQLFKLNVFVLTLAAEKLNLQKLFAPADGTWLVKGKQIKEIKRGCIKYNNY